MVNMMKIKLCPSCQRKQYVARAICICGFIPYEDTLDDDERCQFRLNKISTVLKHIALNKRIQFIQISFPRWKRYITLHKHAEKKRKHIPVHSTHYLGHKSRTEELRKYNQARQRDRQKDRKAMIEGKYNPQSIRQKVADQGYLSELKVGLQQQKEKAVAEDLCIMKKEYVKIRAVNVQLSGKTTSVMMVPHDVKRRRKIVLNQQKCTSRQRSLIDIKDANSINEIVDLLKKENDLLIVARMSRKDPRDILRQRLTREQLLRERAMRAKAEENRIEMLRLQTEQAMSDTMRKKAVQARASDLFARVLRKWQLAQMSKGWTTWYCNTRPGAKDYSKEAMRKENVSVAKHHQSMGLARRLRRLVRMYR